MTMFRLTVDKALANVGPFPRPVAEAILEIAYLTMAVDEELRDDELDAFSVIAAAMLTHEAEASDWLDKFGDNLDRSNLHERLEAAVQKLGVDRGAKLASYRVACLMAMSDLDAHDREFEFDLDLIATLGLTQDEADKVIEEVNAALAPPAN